MSNSNLNAAQGSRDQASSSNKVDMSLDDIIKIERKNKNRKLKIKGNLGRGGNKNVAVNRGMGRRGLGRGKGRGNGSQRADVKVNIQSNRPGQGRGRGNGKNNTWQNKNFHQGRERGRGRGRGLKRSDNFQGKQLIFNSSQMSQRPGNQQLQSSVTQQQQIKIRQQAALLREKQLALKNLQMARQNVQSINMALQKKSRENLINERRGINTATGGNAGARGRKKLLTSLKRHPDNSFANNSAPSRQMVHTSVTISNPAALSHPISFQNQSQRKDTRRKWRNNKKKAHSDHFTIQVANENLQQPSQGGNQQQNILEQLKTLKPAVSTQYKFQKSVFATPATGVSLSDRFSGSKSLEDVGNVTIEGRHVYL